MAETGYEINYEDQRFQDVEAAKQSAISDMEKLYSGMADDTQSYYQAQIDASKEWEKKQTQLQQEQTDFAISKIEQEKEQAKKDYTKEQSGAYVDWQKQSNGYGAESEKMAAQGLSNTGYSESSQVSMYNTYQNRVAMARESYSQAVQNYNNSITQARLQNSSVLAEIAYKSLQQQLELSLQGFQYKNQLLLEQAKRKTELDQMYYERWQDVLEQMNTENALAEEIRQFNQLHPTSSGGGGGGGGGGYSYRSSSGGTTPQIGKTDTTDTDGGDLPSDTAKSILALGLGPISAKGLANQVNAGAVTSTKSSTTGNPIFKSTTPITSSSSAIAPIYDHSKGMPKVTVANNTKKKGGSGGKF